MGSSSYVSEDPQAHRDAKLKAYEQKASEAFDQLLAGPISKS